MFYLRILPCIFHTSPIVNRHFGGEEFPFQPMNPCCLFQRLDLTHIPCLLCVVLQAAVIGGMSYNKLVEKLLEFRSLSGEGSLSSEGAVELSNSHGTGRSVSALAGDGTSPGTESEDMLTERGPTTNVGGQTSETTSNVAEQSSTACSTSSTPSLVRSTVLRAPKDPQEGHPSESSQVLLGV